MQVQERCPFTVMCGTGRPVPPYRISPARSGFDPARPSAAARAAALPRIPVTGGLPALVPAAKRASYRNAGPRFMHVRKIHLRNRFNQNNAHEQNGEFREGRTAYAAWRRTTRPWRA